MDISSEPCTCSGVEVVGLTRTRPYVITEAFQQNTRTFGELLKSVDSGVKALEATDLFSSVSASLREDKGHPARRPPRSRCASRQPYALKQNHEIQVSLKKRVAGGRVLEAAFNEGAGAAPWAPGAAETRAQQLGTTAARLSLGANWFAEWSRRAGLQDGSLSDKWSLSYGGSSESAASPGGDGAAHHRVEVAGVGGLGDAAFVKAEAGAQAHARLAATANGFVAASVAAPARWSACRPPAREHLQGRERRAAHRDGPGAADERRVAAAPQAGQVLPRPVGAAGRPLRRRRRKPPGLDPAAADRPQRAPSVLLRAWRDMRSPSAPAESAADVGPSPPEAAGDALPFAGAATGGTLFYAAAASCRRRSPARRARRARGPRLRERAVWSDADLLTRRARLAKDLATETRAAAGVGLSARQRPRLELNYAGSSGPAVRPRQAPPVRHHRQLRELDQTR
ncbi:hypothetical protein JL721_8652 [Aureococcus anophagefferens]|nr:hypothetical protein JL721_8652 [Aureococcus anophagefferens]